MTQKLTFSTGPQRAAVARLAAGLATIRDYRDYFHGWRHPEPGGPLLPDNVLVFCRRDGRDLKPTTPSYHHRHVLVIALAGAGQVEVDGRRFGLAPGGALAISPFALHRYPSVPRRGLCWLFITCEPPPRAADTEPAAAYTVSREAMDLAAMLVRWRLAGGDRPSDTLARSMALGLGLLLERLAATPGPPAEAAGGAVGPDAAWIEPVVRRVRAVDRPPPTTDELAEAAGVSPSHLRALFRQRFGMSLGVYRRRYRVHRAMGLVVNQGMRIGEAAESCGFSSVYAFSRTARSVLGCSPSAYAATARGGAMGVGQADGPAVDHPPSPRAPAGQPGPCPGAPLAVCCRGVGDRGAVCQDRGKGHEGP